DVDAPRGVGEHLQHVVFGARAIHAGSEGLALLPDRPPLGLGFAEIVTGWRRRHGITSHKCRATKTGPQKTEAAADARYGPHRQAWVRGSGPAGDAQLPGAGKDRVLDVDVGARVDLGVDPATTLGRRRLLEHRDPHAIGPKIAVEDGDLHLHALVGS